MTRNERSNSPLNMLGLALVFLAGVIANPFVKLWDRLTGRSE